MARVTAAEYKRRTEKDWYGTKVRLMDEIRNGRTVIPTGTVLKVMGKFDGFTLEGNTCECCGVSVLISRVNPDHVEVVE